MSHIRVTVKRNIYTFQFCAYSFFRWREYFECERFLNSIRIIFISLLMYGAIEKLFSQSVAKRAVWPKINSDRWLLVFKQSKDKKEKPFKLMYSWNHFLLISDKFFRISFACVCFRETPKILLTTRKSIQVRYSLHEFLSNKISWVFFYLSLKCVFVASNNKKTYQLMVMANMWKCPHFDIYRR